MKKGNVSAVVCSKVARISFIILINNTDYNIKSVLIFKTAEFDFNKQMSWTTRLPLWRI